MSENQELPLMQPEQKVPEMQQQLEIVKPKDAAQVTTTFQDKETFVHNQRVAQMLATSSLIPKEFQGNIQNVMIALEMANRIGASPLMIMQNLYIVYGKPSFSSTFIISAINSCKRFSPLRFEITGTGDDETCLAWAIEKETGERIDGVPVSIKMAKDEGWFGKTGSKWKTMPQLMLRYRAATFFGRLYAPDVLMGMHTHDEYEDIEPISFEERKENLKNAPKVDLP